MKLCLPARRAVLLLALAAACNGAAWGDSLVLKGTVGQAPIVMQVDVQDGQADGTYFYGRFRQDIDLSGTVDPQGARLKSEETGDRFTLTRSGDSFKGSFSTAKGKSLPVALSVVAPGSVPDPRPDLNLQLQDYDRLRLGGVQFTPGKKETVGGRYTIQWYVEPLSKISMFRVVDGYPPAVLQGINHAVDRDYYSSLAAYFGCVGNGDQGSGSGASTHVSSYYLDERFVSYAIASSWDCRGTAHPDFGTTGTTVDARSGKPLDLDDLWWLGSGPKPARDSDAWIQYRTAVFAPAVVELFKKLYPKQMNPDATDGGCDYSQAEVWSSGEGYLTARGLYLDTDFSGAARACNDPDWSYVPYSVLKKNNPALFGN